MVKRERLEIIYDILKIIRNNNNSIRPTPLLRYSNLSTSSFNVYKEDMIQRKLVKIIEDNKNNKYYTLTDNGFKYIDKYKSIKEFCEDFNF